MSLTLLEGLVALILLVVAWRIGTEIAPLIFRALRRTFDQVDQVSQDNDMLDQTALKKEQTDANPKSK